MEVFLQPEMLNVFNEDGVLTPDNGTDTLQAFDPFTTTPVEGTHWERQEGFGEAQGELDFQTPRTFRFSVGFRF